MLSNYSKQRQNVDSNKKGILTKEKKNYRYHECTYLKLLNSLYLNYKEEGREKKNTLKEMTIQTNIVENQEKSK